MWICPVCKEKCDDDAEFCIMCGTRNPIIAGKALNSSNYNWICPSCGSECATDATFCINCGAPRSGDAVKSADAGIPINNQVLNTLIERGRMDLNDRDWADAENCFSRVLDMDPRSAEANLGMFMAESAIPTETAVKERMAQDHNDILKSNKYWKRAREFAQGDLKIRLSGWEVKAELSVKDIKAKKLMKAFTIASLVILIISILITFALTVDIDEGFYAFEFIFETLFLLLAGFEAVIIRRKKGTDKNIYFGGKSNNIIISRFIYSVLAFAAMFLYIGGGVIISILSIVMLFFVVRRLKKLKTKSK